MERANNGNEEDMSFKGYYRVLCENGHLEGFDVHMNNPTDFVCPTCGEGTAWSEIIDLTDGQDDCEITQLEIEHERVEEKCDKCHSIIKISERETYKIPKE